MSESWEETVGSMERPKTRISYKPAKKYEHEPLEISLNRSNSARASLKNIGIEVGPNQNKIDALIGFKRFTFYLLSDTWYSESKGVFGVGIEALCQKIKKHLGSNLAETSNS